LPDTLVAAIVGIDGCGKTSTFRGTVAELARRGRAGGVGDEVLWGEPGSAITARTDVPLSRSARAVGAAAKGLRRPTLYKDLKFLEFIERSHVRNYLLRHDPPATLVGDGDPLVNIAAWAIARYSRGELAHDDDLLVDVLHFLAGERRIPWRRMPFYLRRGWQLAVLNRLHLANFSFPDLVVLLEIDPAVAMTRIRARGRELQVHENEAFLGELAAAYERVCKVLETRCGVPVVRVRVDTASRDDTIRAATAAIEAGATRRADVESLPSDAIAVIATTMSGSFEDQRKVGRIGSAFRALTDREVRVYRADTHAAAQRLAHDVVGRGGRIVVSAGGAGTFNAVLEGCNGDAAIPPDLRLGFLRKGSADLIGKVLHVPDDLAAAAAAITGGIDTGRTIAADVLAVTAQEPDGTMVRRHVVGFGGFGVFGEVPRFTESRFIKLYKGLLGSLFGDLGPFYVGLTLATLTWWLRRLLGRGRPMAYSIDGTELPAATWVAVIVLNGDLGKDFPLGRGHRFDSGGFRVVALRYAGPRMVFRQIAACRTGAILARPDAYAAVVRDAEALTAHPVHRGPPYMVNVDGLRMFTRGQVHIAPAGRVALIEAAAAAAGPATTGVNES
jgi:diacylglycerol kinase family enzyme/thymidylate kinase